MKFKDFFKPKKEFTKETKANFLAAFDARYKTQPASHFALVFKIVIAVFAVFAVTAGASVYADTKNVPTTNPLYPLKRIGESVQLALTPAQDKPQLQVTFAARRKQEIDTLQKTNPTSTLLPSLDNDLHTEINDSVTAADNTNLQDGKLKDFCDQLLSVVATPSSTASSSPIHVAFELHPRILGQFEAKCDEDDNSSNDGDSNNSSTASTTIQTSSTIIMPPVFGSSTTSSTHHDGGIHLRIDR